MFSKSSLLSLLSFFRLSCLSCLSCRFRAVLFRALFRALCRGASLLLALCVALEDAVGLIDAQLARLREVEAPLARILHQNLDDAAVVVRLGKVGVELDALRVVLEGLGQVAREGLQRGAVVVAVGEVGEELDGLVQVGDGLVVAVRALAVVVEPVGRVGVDGNPLVGVVNRRDEVNHLGPRGRTVEVEERIGRVEVDGARVGVHRVGVLLDERLRDAPLEEQRPRRGGAAAQLLQVALVEHDERIGRDVARTARHLEVAVADAALEVLGALHVVGARHRRRVGLHERELEERQQAHVLFAAVVAADAAAARELAVEREQAVEALRRVGVNRIGAVAQPRAVFGDFAAGDVAVLAGPLGVAQQFAQRAAVEVGVRKVGVELDGRGVVLDRLLDFTQLGVDPRAVVVDQHVVG
mgnify:CR=1 FL=1